MPGGHLLHRPKPTLAYRPPVLPSSHPTPLSPLILKILVQTKNPYPERVVFYNRFVSAEQN